MRLIHVFLLPPIAVLLAFTAVASAEESPYDVYPAVEPPYFRVRYEASSEKGELNFPVKYTVWIPPNAATLRGVIVHQHGCGEGSCKSGLTGAFDLHWEALASKHDCALLAPAYEQPQAADCQLWCDPRNGSDAAFQKSLTDLGKASGHPELDTIPWTLWGHSGGGVWAGTMTLLHPDRVAAAWLRSGVPILDPIPERPSAKTVLVPETPLDVPIMLNLGTKEGVTVTEGRFSGLWPKMKALFHSLRAKGGLIGVAVDPLTSHECGNQRYLAIPWFDVCLSARLPERINQPLKPMPTNEAWLAPLLETEAFPSAEWKGDPMDAIWLPNEAIAMAWMQYVKDTAIEDTTPPPSPTNLRVADGELSWDAEVDFESGLAHFIIERDGKEIATVPTTARNPFGRALFQGLQYSDTPLQPLAEMRFTDKTARQGENHSYRVIAVNTLGLKSTDDPARVAPSTTAPGERRQ
ncbi:hypothetical protein RISK_004106 [Rhodopirellula islandica]|uniref:Signal peptide and transmembrane protein n=1 Tax=Rhodopirellula islandica TaxID=595434 RepID=A0A0J1EDT5_RHOIS|nr:hypothetical protein [Rhodopirellula islandica]KLU03699.1 hypothetical protein RISK_004106 [Rhodopirellula islandica]